MKTNLDSRIVVLFLILLGAVWLSLYKTRPPTAVPSSAPETEFSAERAIEHVYAISQEPHMTGTLEIYRVRDYILSAMADIGIEAEVQTTLAQNPLREDEVALVENIIARIPGTDSSQGIMYVGHYDSAPHSPGAGDDGVAVAVMIETARAVRAGTPLKNDVIFLFSDAEESTIGGAIAARKHPWMSEVGLVINLEMRGSSGPVYMFETGPDNGWVIPELAEAIPHPATSSLMRDVYTNMPNNTDFTAFRDAGYAGFNFSVLEGSTTYHTPRDQAENMDLRSIQHHGSNTLGIARHFGVIELDNIKAEDAVYFDVLGSTLVHYPGSWSIPLVIVALTLFSGLVIYGFRKGNLSLKGIGQGFLAFLAALVGGPGFVTLLWFGIRAVANPPMIYGDTYNSPVFFLSFALLIVAITAALYNLFQRKVNTANLAVGALVWWVVFLLGITIVFPKANFFFLWPLVFAILGVAYWIFTDGKALSWTGVAVLSVSVLPGLLIVPPTTYSVLMGLVALVSLTGTGMVLLSFLLGLMVPHFSAMAWSETGLGRWWFSAGSGLLGILVLIFAVATIRVDADHPRLFQLIYALDNETGEAVWASAQGSEYNEDWTAQFFSEDATNGPLPQFFGGDRPQFKIDQAPVAPLPMPKIDVLENPKEGDIHRIRLSIASTGGANQARFYIEPPVEVLSVALNGEQLRMAETPPSAEEPWTLAYFGPLTTPIELSLEIRAESAITMRIVEVSKGLPEFQEMSYTPLPDYLAALSCFCRDDSRMTYISNAITFEE